MVVSLIRKSLKLVFLAVLGLLLFLVYINDLPDNILANMKLFSADSSLFNRVSDVNITHSLLETDHTTIQNWAHQWKMVFNPDITKQAIEIVFSVKNNKPIHPPLSFNNVPVARKPFSKHLGLYMDETLSFSKHISISLLKFLSKYVSKDILTMSSKMYVRLPLDYDDVIYHNQRENPMDLLEQVQYKAVLVVSGCWQSTSCVKIYS